MHNERTTHELHIESADLGRLVAEPYQLERIATGFIWTEGPLWFTDGAYLLFSDIPNDAIYRWDEQNGLQTFRHPCGFTNGHALDPQGRLISCEHQNRRVSRTEADGRVTAVVTHYGDKRLNTPNDVVVRSDGTIFFTDPTYGFKPDEGDAGPGELDWKGVYSVQPDGTNLMLLSKDFTAPNGLCLSADERTLYVDDSEDKLLRSFAILPDGTLGSGRLIADNIREDGVSGGPDGVKLDTDGRIWITGPGGIRVYEADGTLIGTLPVPERCSNLNWGDADHKTLYITASSSVYRVRLNVSGVGIWLHTS